MSECKDTFTRHVQCKAWTLSRSDGKCRLKSKKESIERKKGLEWMKRISGTEACYGFISQTSGDNEKHGKIGVEEFTQSATELAGSGFDS